MKDQVVVKPIASEETYELRHKVLRPNQSLQDCKYPLDHDVSALHIGCFLDSTLVAVGTIFCEDREGNTSGNVWRIRGMAVSPGNRGKGIGGKVLSALINHVEQQHPGAEIWCNGRECVKEFYEHFGFLQVGDAFELPMIGLHVVMVKQAGKTGRT